MATPDRNATHGIPVRIQHTSLEAFDSPKEHMHDAKAIFDRAVMKGVWACTGTEAGGGQKNHDMRDALIQQARIHDFYIFSHPAGEWVACNKAFMKDFTHGFSGPYIPAKGGRGGHGPRGITWVQGVSREHDLGRIAFGSAHYLTDRAEGQGNLTNDPLIRGIGLWGRKMGEGSKVCFISADTNTNDKLVDVFDGRPFTTISDELKKWPATHGRRAIDIIASYNGDGRVKAKSYDVKDDSEFQLNTDHYLLHAVYEITEIRAKA